MQVIGDGRTGGSIGAREKMRGESARNRGQRRERVEEAVYQCYDRCPHFGGGGRLGKILIALLTLRGVSVKILTRVTLIFRRNVFSEAAPAFLEERLTEF